MNRIDGKDWNVWYSMATSDNGLSQRPGQKRRIGDRLVRGRCDIARSQQIVILKVELHKCR